MYMVFNWKKTIYVWLLTQAPWNCAKAKLGQKQRKHVWIICPEGICLKKSYVLSDSQGKLQIQMVLTQAQ